MKLLVQSTYFNLGKETVSFPITVIPSPPGQYSCDIIMKAPNDVRVYHVECTLKYKDVQVELEFTSPTHQTVLQNVPIVSSVIHLINYCSDIGNQNAGTAIKCRCSALLFV